MKKLELSIFKRLAFSIIGIIFIPIILFISNEVLSRSQNELEEKRKEGLRNLDLIYSKLVDTYASLEAIQLIVNKDINFLDFLTSEEKHSPVEYVVFQRGILKNYEKLLQTSREISEFRIYVDNENLLEIYPYIKKQLPENKFLQNETKLTIKNGRPFLYYFKEIYYYPKNIYLEMEVDLSKLFDEIMSSYYFIDKGKIINPTSKETEKIEKLLLKIDFDSIEKTKGIKENDDLYIFQELPFTDVVLLINLYQKGIIDISYLGYLIFLAVLILAAIYFISYNISKKVFRQLDFIFDGVNEIKKGNLKINFPNNFENIEFFELANQLMIMSKNIDSLINENMENQKLVNDFQMKALQSQINSHFLQNSLEGIKMMAYMNKDYEVSDSLLSLGKILRYGMEWKNPIVSINDELEYLKQYISLFSMRTDNEIFFRIYIEEDLKSIKIPKMILQPLVENSIIHGIIPKDAIGFIQIRIYKRENYLIFDLLDNGNGMNEKEMSTTPEGIGVYNVQKRLELFFNKKVIFNMRSEEGKFTRIEICVESQVNYEKSINC